MGTYVKYTVIALVVAFAAYAQAARFPSYGSIQVDGLPDSLVAWQSESLASTGHKDNVDAQFLASAVFNDLEALTADLALQKEKRGPIHIASRLLVKPELDGSFIHNYWAFRRRSGQNKGILHLSLNKVSGDNIVWTLYTVYEDVHALFDHMRSDALREYASFITYSNIAVEYKMLFKIGGGHRPKNADAKDVGMFEPNMPGSTAGDAGFDAAVADGEYFMSESTDDNRKGGGGGKRRSRPLKLITAYIVPPGQGRDFIKEWERAEKKISKAEGNIAFGLMKPADDNVMFVGFSMWKSFEDFLEAAESKAAREWIEFLGNEGIVAVTKKLYTVPPRHPKA